MKHTIKIESVYFKQVLSGEKCFEVRYNDRGYQKGDSVTLMEKSTLNGMTTGRQVEVEIIYIHSGYGLKEGFVILGIERLDDLKD